MIIKIYSAILLFFVSATAFAQIVSGPMLGPIELRDAKIWVEVSSAAKKVQLVYNRKGESAKSKTISYNGSLGAAFNPVTFTVGGLEPNTTYQYKLVVDGKPLKETNEFTTKDLWQWRKPAPDFSFIT